MLVSFANNIIDIGINNLSFCCVSCHFSQFMSSWHVILQISGISSKNYMCTCSYGFTGFDCEVKLDECVLKNCTDCVNGTCQCPIGEFSLTCAHQYTRLVVENSIIIVFRFSKM